MTETPDAAAFAEHHRGLLELERRAEIEEAKRLWAELPEHELERRGVTLLRLTPVDLQVTLGGRSTVSLERDDGRELPSHRISVGDVVALRTARAQGGIDERGDASGVVSRVADRQLRVTLDDADEATELPARLRVDRVAPDVTFRRLDAAMRRLGAGGPGPARTIRAVAFGGREPAFLATPTTADLGFRNTRLDASQRAAVAHALRAEDLALIHGPPGTGKTTAVVEVVHQAVRRGLRVLACAPSNVAVDNLVERLAGPELRVVRLGHPARLLPWVQEHCLDALVEGGHDGKVLKGLRRDVEKLQRSHERVTRPHQGRQVRAALRDLRREIRRVEDAAVRGILDTADVICATTTGAATALLRDRDFGLVVLDEAAQTVEAGAWIPLLHARRAVLAGDHCQLPPTILSARAARDGLARTLFERLDELHGARCTRLLTVQYRMHERIMEWASRELYAGRLTADPSVAAHRLADLPHVTGSTDTRTPLLFYDTAGCGFEETSDPTDRSRANPGEVRVVRAHVDTLLAAGVRPAELGVITPYNAQVALLRDALHAHGRELEIGTVDGFQGREKEAIVISCVRSNDRGEVGFLAESRRMNVAVTRARRHVALVGDSATLGCDAFLARLVEHCQERGDYRSTWDFA